MKQTAVVVRSAQEWLEQAVPAMTLQEPQEEDFEAARRFSETLASKGDILQFPAEAYKEQSEAQRMWEDLARHIATAAYCPGGIEIFGSRFHVEQGALHIERNEEGYPGIFPEPDSMKILRKTTGTFYTPMTLITSPLCLLDTALEPVIADQKADGQPLLELTICDPACGSGAFLWAAAERMATHLAKQRYPETEPTLAQWRGIRRDLVGHCLFGVDLNPAAAELCKLTLSLQCIDPTACFPYLDAHIRHGNSICGLIDNAIMHDGIPDGAFEPIEGDDPVMTRKYKKRNQAERAGQHGLFVVPAEEPDWDGSLAFLAQAFKQLDAMPDATIEQWQWKREAHRCLLDSDLYQWNKLRADAWCAAFVWKKNAETSDAITEEVFRSIERDPTGVAPWLKAEIERLATQYQFFHWHLDFAQVMYGSEQRIAEKRAQDKAFVEAEERKQRGSK